jgi:hypothetical protein
VLVVVGPTPGGGAGPTTRPDPNSPDLVRLGRLVEPFAHPRPDALGPLGK